MSNVKKDLIELVNENLDKKNKALLLKNIINTTNRDLLLRVIQKGKKKQIKKLIWELHYLKSKNNIIDLDSHYKKIMELNSKIYKTRTQLNLYQTFENS